MKVKLIIVLVTVAAGIAQAATDAAKEAAMEREKKTAAINSATAMQLPIQPMKRLGPQPSNANLPVKPPQDAVVLFDGTNLDKWSKINGQPAHWKVENGYVEVATGGNIRTREEFGDCRLHVEFWLPLMADKQGQARANSGVYLLGRHEVQVLDTYQLAPADNGCGGIYRVATPEVNASLPPEQWQSYDIFYTAPQLKDGQMVQPAKISVIQNGVRIHRNVEINLPHTGGPIGANWVDKGPLMLQDHNGDKVRYRNIWLVPGNTMGTLRLQPMQPPGGAGSR